LQATGNYKLENYLYFNNGGLINNQHSKRYWGVAMKLLWIILSILAATAQAIVFAETQIYKEVDSDGVIHVGNKPQEKQLSPESAASSLRLFGIGDTGRDGGITVTFKGIRKIDRIILKNGSSLYPGEGAQFIEISITIRNDGMESKDIYCRYDIGTALYDEKMRKFDRIPQHYNIAGNMGCNEMLQPGFSEDEILVFKLPGGTHGGVLSIWDPNEIKYSSDPRWDPFGDKSSAKFRAPF
jgi:hypothetical protein